MKPLTLFIFLICLSASCKKDQNTKLYEITVLEGTWVIQQEETWNEGEELESREYTSVSCDSITNKELARCEYKFIGSTCDYKLCTVDFTEDFRNMSWELKEFISGEDSLFIGHDTPKEFRFSVLLQNDSLT